MKKYYLRLYSYNIWANRIYLDFLSGLESVPERIQLMFSHVLTAQTNWLNRIIGKQVTPLPYWEMWALEDLKSLAETNSQNYLNYLSEADDAEFERMVTYVNMQNLPYENTVGDILTQTANHATYHRAQFAVLLRQAGINPPNTDFITFARNVK